MEMAKQWIVELDGVIQSKATDTLSKIFKKWTDFLIKNRQVSKCLNNSLYEANSAKWNFSLRATGDVRQLVEFKQLKSLMDGIVQRAEKEATDCVIRVMVMERDAILKRIVHAYASLLFDILKSFLVSKKWSFGPSEVHQHMMEFISKHPQFITSSFNGMMTKKMFLTEYLKAFPKLKELPRPLSAPTFIDDCLAEPVMFIGATARLPAGTNPYDSTSTPNGRRPAPARIPASGDNTAGNDNGGSARSSPHTVTHNAIVQMVNGNQDDATQSPSTSTFNLTVNIKDKNDDLINLDEYSSDIKDCLQQLMSKLRVVDTLPPPEAAGNVDANQDVSASRIVESISINPTIKKNVGVLQLENTVQNTSDDADLAVMDLTAPAARTEADATTDRPRIPRAPTAKQLSINEYMLKQTDRFFVGLSDKYMEMDELKLLRKAQVEAFRPEKDEKANMATELLSEELAADRPVLDGLLERKVNPFKKELQELKGKMTLLNKSQQKTELENKRLRDEVNTFKSNSNRDSKRGRQDPKKDQSGSSQPKKRIRFGQNTTSPTLKNQNDATGGRNTGGRKKEEKRSQQQRKQKSRGGRRNSGGQRKKQGSQQN